MYYSDNGDLHLTREEVKSLINRELGHGTDGRVINIDNKTLLKLYHSKLKDIYKEYDDPLDDSDIKIYDKSRDLIVKRPFEEMFSFYGKDSESQVIKLRSEYAISQARERQFKVLNTRLPKNAVYIDGKFAGCLLTKVRGLQIHKFMGLPKSIKAKILLKVLDNLQELFDNYIYHVDLDNSPFSKNVYYINENGKAEIVGHSHVLVNPITLVPNIIDLDGKSTIYTDFKCEDLEKTSLDGFISLMLEFLLEIDLDEYEDYNDIYSELNTLGIKLDMAEKLSTKDLTIDELKDFLAGYTKGKSK